MSAAAPCGIEAATVGIVDQAGFQALRPDWEALWQRRPEATPFQSPAWVMSWAAHYAPGRCWVVALRAGARLLAVLPVFWWDGRLLLAGTGPSDHATGLFAPGAESWAGELLAQAWRACPWPTTQIDLQQLPAGSPLLTCETPPGWRSTVCAGEICPALDLAGPDGMAQVVPRWRTNWRYAMRRIGRESGLLDLVPAQEVAATLPMLEQLHALRWRHKAEEDGVLADPLLRALLRDAAPALAEAGSLRLHRLRLRGETIAILLAMRGTGRTCYYLSGFDPAFARLSPGLILVGAAIATAAREGDRLFDFLRGQEGYKYDWGARDVATARRVMVAPA